MTKEPSASARQDSPGDGEIARLALADESATSRFSSALRDILRWGNYATPFVANKCKTDVGEVARWKTGASTPGEVAWVLLCSVSREFSRLTTLLEEARAEANARSSGDGQSTPEGQDRDEPPARDGVAGEASSTESVGSADLEREPGLAAGETPDLDSASARPETAPSPTPPPPSARPSIEPANAPDPSGFVVYTCKIGQGRFAQLALPVLLTHQDVRRLHAFLLSQVD